MSQMLNSILANKKCLRVLIYLEVFRDYIELTFVYTNKACYNQVYTLVSGGNIGAKVMIK